GGAGQTNVIPPDAWANLDVRLLPGEDPQAFLESIRRVVAHPDVTVQPANADFRFANSSPTDTRLFQAIRQVSSQYFPGTPVAPRITSGYTENQRYRPLGIHCYGFSPYTAKCEERPRFCLMWSRPWPGNNANQKSSTVAAWSVLEASRLSRVMRGAPSSSASAI